MKVSFVRRRGQRDHVYVTRTDGSSAGWDFPSYGNDLPHDLCHLVVEDALGIVHGFWGLVDLGIEIKLVNNQVTLVRGGKPLVDDPSVDFSDLNKAELAVALLGPVGLRSEQVGALTVVGLDPAASASDQASRLRSEVGFDLPEGASEETLSSVRTRLSELRRQWQSLGEGLALVLTYPGQKT